MSIPKEIITQEFGKRDYKIYFSVNHKHLGNAVMDIDGYYLFYPEENNRGWSSYGLNLVKDTIDALNEEWNNHIKTNLK